MRTFFLIQFFYLPLFFAQIEELIKKDDSFLYIPSYHSEVLTIAFGGVGEHFGIPRYEFVKILSNFSTSILFVRDIQRAYYQFGIETGGNISKTLKVLETEIQRINPKSIVIFGNSAGGYAALLYGFILSQSKYPVSGVHAFSPIFSTNAVIEQRYKAYPYIEPKYFYLHKFFGKKSPPCRNFHIYYALDEAADVTFSKKFRHCKWITHHIYQHGKHELIKDLRKNGELLTIIERAIGGA